ncbi:MAG: GNAT family N-acetyltransferase [Casimicrobiaceae bacterium]
MGASATADSRHWTIADRGVLCEGQCIRVGWPEGDEFDAITALRNRPEVCRQFLDARPLDPVRNRRWLQHEINRPYEAVLAIRMKIDDAFVGSIGWSKGDATAGTLELGRVMVDAARAIAYRRRLPPDYAGIALDAGVALRDFLFAALPLRTIRMTVIVANRLSLRAATAGGGRIVASGVERRADGAMVDVAYLECTRDDGARVAPPYPSDEPFPSTP